MEGKTNPFSLTIGKQPHRLVLQTWYRVPLRKCYECYKDKNHPVYFNRVGRTHSCSSDSFLTNSAGEYTGTADCLKCSGFLVIIPKHGTGYL